MDFDLTQHTLMRLIALVNKDEIKTTAFVNTTFDP